MNSNSNSNSMITKSNERCNPPPFTPAEEATHALGTLMSRAKDLTSALKALPKVDAYRGIWSKATTDAMRVDTLKVVDQMEQKLRHVRELVEGTLRNPEEA